MQVMTENKVIPKLRFSEFNEEWEIIRLQDLAIRITEKNRDNKIQTVLTNSATKGIVSQADYFDRDIANKNNLDGYYIVNIGDYVYNPRISKFAPVGPIKKNNLVLGLMSPLYSVFRFNTSEDEFFENYFETTAWHKYMKGVANYGARHDRMNISNSDFFKMPIPIPSLPEQQKIASFLSAVDEKLQQLTKKKDLLEKYKKGVMQKIFSQELRFKDELGNNYPNWEEKRIEDLFIVTRGTVLAIPKISPHKNDECPYPVYSSQTKNNGIAGYYKDYLFEDAITWTTDGAQAGEVNLRKGKFYCTNVCGVLKSDEGYVNLCIAEKLNRVSRRYVSYVGNPKLMNNVMAKIKISIPSSIDEQHKIAIFLSVIDKKIALVSTQIEKTKAFKKGLLQQMFV